MEKTERNKKKNRRKTNDDKCTHLLLFSILLLDLSLSFLFFSFVQEEAHNKRNSNFLFSISVGYLCIFKKREQTVLMNKEKLDIKDKRKKIDFVNHVEKKGTKKTNSTQYRVPD
jgi:hypothetical protein